VNTEWIARDEISLDWSGSLRSSSNENATIQVWQLLWSTTLLKLMLCFNYFIKMISAKSGQGRCIANLHRFGLLQTCTDWVYCKPAQIGSIANLLWLGLLQTCTDWVYRKPAQIGFIVNLLRLGLLQTYSAWVYCKPAQIGSIANLHRLGLLQTYSDWVYCKPAQSGFIANLLWLGLLQTCTDWVFPHQVSVNATNTTVDNRHVYINRIWRRSTITRWRWRIATHRRLQHS